MVAATRHSVISSAEIYLKLFVFVVMPRSRPSISASSAAATAANGDPLAGRSYSKSSRSLPTRKSKSGLMQPEHGVASGQGQSGAVAQLQQPQSYQPQNAQQPPPTGYPSSQVGGPPRQSLGPRSSRGSQQSYSVVRSDMVPGPEDNASQFGQQGQVPPQQRGHNQQPGQPPRHSMGQRSRRDTSNSRQSCSVVRSDMVSSVDDDQGYQNDPNQRSQSLSGYSAKSRSIVRSVPWTDASRSSVGGRSQQMPRAPSTYYTNALIEVPNQEGSGTEIRHAQLVETPQPAGPMPQGDTSIQRQVPAGFTDQQPPPPPPIKELLLDQQQQPEESRPRPKRKVLESTTVEEIKTGSDAALPPQDDMQPPPPPHEPLYQPQQQPEPFNQDPQMPPEDQQMRSRGQPGAQPNAQAPGPDGHPGDLGSQSRSQRGSPASKSAMNSRTPGMISGAAGRSQAGSQKRPSGQTQNSTVSRSVVKKQMYGSQGGNVYGNRKSMANEGAATAGSRVDGSQGAGTQSTVSQGAASQGASTQGGGTADPYQATDEDYDDYQTRSPTEAAGTQNKNTTAGNENGEQPKPLTKSYKDDDSYAEYDEAEGN